ncbi:MAG: MerR family transcriptional regulator [Oscillospiraceae bacterium]|jgi:DNA-binding transcriptional MerR regulator|nr:MerR family transcriptional regulator [Oscillospiraceae bacterium]
MYTMKETCDQVNITYETLRFYCNEGLVPNVRRDKNNYRIFDERNINWLKSLQCLRKCGMSIRDMKLYMRLCLQGAYSIPERKRMLDAQKCALLEKMREISACIDFIDGKQKYFDGVLEGTIQYASNLVPPGEEQAPHKVI